MELKHSFTVPASLDETWEAFGDLAERLNRELQLERRVGGERRILVRPSPDRRTSPRDRQ